MLKMKRMLQFRNQVKNVQAALTTIDKYPHLKSYQREAVNPKRWRISKDKNDKENPNGNASLCIECGQCLEKCPQKINIPAELKKVNAMFGRRARIANHYPQNKR